MFAITSLLGQSQHGPDQLQFVDVAQHRVGSLPVGPAGGEGGGGGGGGEGHNLKYQNTKYQLLLRVIQTISLSEHEERGLLLSDLTSLLSSVKLESLRLKS